MTENIKKVAVEESDEVTQLTCDVCKSKEFILLFNIEKLKKSEEDKLYLGFRESKKVKCAVCGASILIGIEK